MERSLEAVFFSLLQKSLAADAKDFGGSGNVVARSFERLRNHVALDQFQGTQAGEHGSAASSGAEIFWKIIRSKFGAFAEDDGALEGVAEFADVAGPFVNGKHATRSIRERPVGAIVNRTERNEEMIGEGKNVQAAFAERGNAERQNVEAEKKIFAELACGDGGLEISVGDCDEARFDAKSFGAAEALECALLQNTQQFCLRVRGKSGDFVQDNCTGAAEFEAAELAIHGSRERAAFVAEKFAFDESGRECGAINFEVRRIASRAEFVNEAGEMVLAGTGLASDEKRCGSSSDFFRKLQHAARSGVLSDPGEPVGHGLIVAAHAGLGAAALGRLVETDKEGAEEERTAVSVWGERTYRASRITTGAGSPGCRVSVNDTSLGVETSLGYGEPAGGGDAGQAACDAI